MDWKDFWVETLIILSILAVAALVAAGIYIFVVKHGQICNPGFHYQIIMVKPLVGICEPN